MVLIQRLQICFVYIPHARQTNDANTKEAKDGRNRRQTLHKKGGRDTRNSSLPIQPLQKPNELPLVFCTQYSLRKRFQIHSMYKSVYSFNFAARWMLCSQLSFDRQWNCYGSFEFIRYFLNMLACCSRQTKSWWWTNEKKSVRWIDQSRRK